MKNEQLKAGEKETSMQATSNVTWDKKPHSYNGMSFSRLVFGPSLLLFKLDLLQSNMTPLWIMPRSFRYSSLLSGERNLNEDWGREAAKGCSGWRWSDPSRPQKSLMLHAMIASHGTLSSPQKRESVWRGREHRHWSCNMMMLMTARKKIDFYQTVVAAQWWWGVKHSKSMSNKIQKSYEEEFDRCFAIRDFSRKLSSQVHNNAMLMPRWCLMFQTWDWRIFQIFVSREHPPNKNCLCIVSFEKMSNSMKNYFTFKLHFLHVGRVVQSICKKWGHVLFLKTWR